MQDSGSVAATPNESEQKIRVRGMTAGACGYIDQAPAADKAEGQWFITQVNWTFFLEKYLPQCILHIDTIMVTIYNS